MDDKELSQLPIVCPVCRVPLTWANGRIQCGTCPRAYEENRYGYLELMQHDSRYFLDPVSDDYAVDQEASGVRLWKEFMEPYFDRERSDRVLDVGCGVGVTLSYFASKGCDAYGIDLPSLSRFWQKRGNDPKRFFCSDAGALPFADSFFDLVISLGVIEHIGTIAGHSSLAADFWIERQAFANELLRVTRPGGRLLIACPNKSFPIDIQHPPADTYSTSPWVRWRSWWYERTGLNIHSPVGRYHLLSYQEVRRLFCDVGGGRSLTPLPLRGYFGFGRFSSGALRLVYGASRLYVEHLPAFLRETLFNPYVLAEVRK